ncbi:hypothetical protein BVRB_4g074070 [Beta vulgaris subsp. vulgaris]|nr:hypothetical protein BVRB_4g074070 [Beta vulgaris subsp. vulgaris]
MKKRCTANSGNVLKPSLGIHFHEPTCLPLNSNES